MNLILSKPSRVEFEKGNVALAYDLDSASNYQVIKGKDNKAHLYLGSIKLPTYTAVILPRLDSKALTISGVDFKKAVENITENVKNNKSAETTIVVKRTREDKEFSVKVTIKAIDPHNLTLDGADYSVQGYEIIKPDTEVGEVVDIH